MYPFRVPLTFFSSSFFSHLSSSIPPTYSVWFLFGFNILALAAAGIYENVRLNAAFLDITLLNSDHFCCSLPERTSNIMALVNASF